MKIAVLQASSQKDKNSTLYQCTQIAVEKNHRSDEVINFGIFEDENAGYSYIEVALMASLLISSGAIDFVVSGCSSGQGMMLAMNSLPGLNCGYLPTPQDAFLFGRINGGNAASLPLGLGYGWLGDINVQLTLDKLFEGDFGIGYPPKEAERKAHDTKLLHDINHLTKKEMREIFDQLDRELVRKVLSRNNVTQYILDYGNPEIKEMIMR